MKIGSHSFFVYTTPVPRFASSQLLLPSPSFLLPLPCFRLLLLLPSPLCFLLLLAWSCPPCLVLSSLSEKGGCWDNKRKRSHKRFAHEALAEREGFEPPAPLSAAVFKTAVIDHSTISPDVLCGRLSFQKRCKGMAFSGNVQEFTHFSSFFS